MNRRVIITLLSVGVSIILALGGVGLYKIHTLKLQAQELLNSKLYTLASQAQSEGMDLKFLPFECDGLIYVECRSKEVSLTHPLLSQEVLSLQNITLKAEEFDFATLGFVFDADVLPPKIAELEEYFKTIFPHHINLKMKFFADGGEKYGIDGRLVFEAEKINYQEDFQASIPQTKSFLSSISSLDFLQEEMDVKNITLTLTSKGLSEAVYEIVKKKYGGIGKREYLALANLMVGASMMRFEGNKEIQDMIAGAGALALGEADEMKIFVKAKNGAKLIPQELLEANKDKALDEIFEKYDFETRLEKVAK